jgi:hypothetical protein
LYRLVTELSRADVFWATFRCRERRLAARCFGKARRVIERVQCTGDPSLLFLAFGGPLTPDMNFSIFSKASVTDAVPFSIWTAPQLGAAVRPRPRIRISIRLRAQPSAEPLRRLQSGR